MIELDRNHLFLPYGPYELVDLVPNGGELPTCRGYMLHERGGWSVEFGSMQGKLMPFYFQCVCGPECGEGAIGVLELREGIWRLIYYKHIWTS